MSDVKLGELDRPIWGVAAIAAVIHRTERATYHLLESGRLPASKMGGRWATTLRRLQRALDPEAA